MLEDDCRNGGRSMPGCWRMTAGMVAGACGDDNYFCKSEFISIFALINVYTKIV